MNPPNKRCSRHGRCTLSEPSLALCHAGFESHNVAVNPDKSKLSFALQLAAHGSAAGDVAGAASGAQGAVMPATVWRSGERGGAAACCPSVRRCAWQGVPACLMRCPLPLRPGDGATFVKWCGLLINTATLELQGDYTR